MEEWICKLYHQDLESEEHHVYLYTAFYEIGNRYQFLVEQGFGTLPNIMGHIELRFFDTTKQPQNLIN